jgi:hypothetical protein
MNSSISQLLINLSKLGNFFYDKIKSGWYYKS